MKIANIDVDSRTLIIAEIGNNHEGDVDRAMQMIHAAAEAGADAVKFQIFKTELFGNPADHDRYKRLQSFELSEEDIHLIERAARDAGVLFIATPLDLDSAARLEPLVDAFKIASGDITFEPLLRQIAQTSRPIILSTGMAFLPEIRSACALIANVRKRPLHDCDLALLHCVSSYPVPEEQANLSSIRSLSTNFPLTVGYSDHTLSIEAAEHAVAAGARIIEKHFTLDKHLSDFRDHQLSADPPELKELVARVRRVETLLGNPLRYVQDCEEHGRVDFRRSIAARRDLPAGHVIAKEDLMWIRPADALQPGREQRLIGQMLSRAVTKGERVDESQLCANATIAEAISTAP